MADARDVLTLAEAKDAINYDELTTTHDGEVERFVTAVSRWLDDICGPVVVRSVTELHDGGTAFIRPRTTPLSAVTTLTEYLDTTGTALTEETNDTKPADAFLVDERSAHNVKVWRRTSGSDSTFTSGRRNIELVYDVGRSADTATADPKFKQAASLLLNHLWKPNAAAWSQQTDPFADRQFVPAVAWKLPPSVRELIRDEMHGPQVG